MDSGLGGLSVLRQIAAASPSVDLLYFADSAYCPYGNRSTEDIRTRVGWIAQHLLSLGAGVLVVACNTASAAALEWLRARVDVPVVGMEPAVKPAASTTRSGRIGVLATPRTLEADRFSRLLSRFASGIEVFSEPALDLVEAVEQGKTEGPEVTGLLRNRLARLMDQQVDTLVLGCTHYPFLTESMKKILGPDVAVIDPGPSVAAQALRVRRATHGPLPTRSSRRGIWFESSAPCREPLAVAKRICPKLDIQCGPPTGDLPRKQGGPAPSR